MESLFKREKLPAEVKRFLKENGTEALEKLIASKSVGTNNLEDEEIKAVSSIENKLVNKVNQVKPNLVCTENQIVATGESKKTVPEISLGRLELLQTSSSKPIQKEWTCGNLIIATGDTKESFPEIAVGREELPRTSTSKPVQKEWTCNICNVTTQSELVFNSHLQGKEHNDKVVTEEIKAKNKTVLSEKTEVNESNAIPSYENKGVTQSNHNEPDVERKHIKPVVVLEKNEVTTVSQVNQAEPNIVQTEKQIIATVETKETVAAPGRELPQTSKPVQREWTCSICNVTALYETVFKSHLRGKKHKKAVLNEAMKVKNQKVVPKIVPSYTPKKSDSPNEEPVNSSKNQTVLPKVVPSYIPKKSDLPDEEPGNSTKTHTVLPKVVYVPKKSDSPNEKPGNSLKNQTVLPEVVSSYTPKKSDQSSVEHANTTKNQTVQPKVGFSYIQKKSDWITIIEASGWDVPSETWQSKPKNISASSAASDKKPGECKEEKVQGQHQKNQNKETVAQNDFSLCCSLCNVRCTSKLDMASHLRGRKHLIQVQTSSGI